MTFKKDRSPMKTSLSYFYHRMTVAPLCGRDVFNCSEQQKKTKLTNKKSALGWLGGNTHTMYTANFLIGWLTKEKSGQSRKKKIQ